MVKFVLWIIGFMPDQSKLYIADKLLGDVLGSKVYAITPEYAEKIITKVIKSGGNKVTDFIVKD